MADYAVANYDARWAEQAERFAETEPTTGQTYLSTKGGRFTIGDQDLGTEICVVVADAVRENVLYEGKYDADVKNPPLCYAYGFAERDMVPHESMEDHPELFVPQSDDCASCPLNKWGSAEKGRGKACQNRRRLALIPAGYFHEPQRRGGVSELEVYTDEAHYVNADLVTLKLPVTSVKNWAKYVKKITDTARRPPYGVVTRIAIVPDKKDQYHLEFEMIELLPDELIDVMTARHEGAASQLIVPYKPWDDGGEQYDERRPPPPTNNRPSLRTRR